MRERRTKDRGVTGMRYGLDVVHEAAEPAKERLVLETRKRPADPGLSPAVTAIGP